MAESTVYLGVPIEDCAVTVEDELDAYTSRIGGRPAWLRPVTATEGKGMSTVVCSNCKLSRHLRLLTQIHAPLDVFDRVLYLFMCASCSTEKQSYVCAFRSQLYNAQYEVIAAKQPKNDINKLPEVNETIFAMDDDEEDGWGEKPPAAVSAPAPSVTAKKAKETPKKVARVAYTISDASIIKEYWHGIRAVPLPLLLLDSFPEPSRAEEKESKVSVEEQLVEAERLYPGSVIDEESNDINGNITSVVQELIQDDATPDETDEEVVMSTFLARVELCRAQCVRWCPRGTQLVSSVTRHVRNVPPCSNCGAPRVFEMQFMSPAIYFFTKYGPRKPTQRDDNERTKLLKENKEDPHFGTIMIFTCSAHCYSETITALPEYVFVEPEF